MSNATLISLLYFLDASCFVVGVVVGFPRVLGPAAARLTTAYVLLTNPAWVLW